MSEKARIRVVAAVIFNSLRQVLITQRPTNSHLAGFWEFPGGKIDPGETPQEALKRELKEELNVEIEVKQLIWQEKFEYPEKHIHIYFFRCQLQSPPDEIKPLEVASWRWVEIYQLNEFRFPPADDFFIKKLQEGLIRSN